MLKVALRHAFGKPTGQEEGDGAEGYSDQERYPETRRLMEGPRAGQVERLSKGNDPVSKGVSHHGDLKTERRTDRRKERAREDPHGHEE